MSDAPKKRPWLQFHLSTAIVMMFVAAGLLWLNLIPRYQYGTDKPCYGWPFTCYFSVEVHTFFSGDRYPVVYGPGFTQIAPFVNLAIAFFVLLTIAVFFEWPIRRKERRP